MTKAAEAGIPYVIGKAGNLLAVGLALAVLAYALAHVWSLNFMLIAAAGVCGLFWGALYRFFPQRLWALVISHAAWDVAVFVLFPIGVG